MKFRERALRRAVVPAGDGQFLHVLKHPNGFDRSVIERPGDLTVIQADVMKARLCATKGVYGIDFTKRQSERLLSPGHTEHEFPLFELTPTFPPPTTTWFAPPRREKTNHRPSGDTS